MLFIDLVKKHPQFRSVLKMKKFVGWEEILPDFFLFNQTNIFIKKANLAS